MECDIQHLVEGKTFTPREKTKRFFSKIKEKAFPQSVRSGNTTRSKATRRGLRGPRFDKEAKASRRHA